jgi:alanine-glyoxylate transaminase/serine-glyoxylate transaminase/serine-pyruvate transaminase
MPAGFDSDAYIVHEPPLDLSLGRARDVKGKVFRIGHLGSLNELELLAGLAGAEMTLKSFGVPVTLGAGVAAAQSYLMDTRPS